MKLTLFFALLISSVILAQQAPAPVVPQRRVLVQPPAQGAKSLSDNYQINLRLTNKDEAPVDVSVVAASNQFSVSFGEQNLSFSGYLSVDEDGTLFVSYSLGWEAQIAGGNNNNAVRYQSSSAGGSVRLKPGEEIQILQVGSRVARLSILKLEATKAK